MTGNFKEQRQAKLQVTDNISVCTKHRQRPVKGLEQIVRGVGSGIEQSSITLRRDTSFFSGFESVPRWIAIAL